MDAKVRTWSDHQDRIFRFVTEDTGNASIEAVAGSGKTTTIVEAANRLDPNSRSLFLAFNKSIAEELGSRLPAHVTAKTLNSLGHGAWSRFVKPKRLKLDSNKTRSIVDENLNETSRKLYGAPVGRMVALAKSAGLVPQGTHGATGLLEDDQAAWLEMIDWHDIDFHEKADPNYAIDLARSVLYDSIKLAETGLIDFDDQLYMTVIYGVPMERFDFVFVDEAQDLNPIQHSLLAMALKDTGRLIAVGDPRQAIYGFRGADAASMDNLQKTFGTTTLPLSISYRCPQNVVAEAQKLVPHIQSHDAAPVGVVGSLAKYQPETFFDTDAILCRNVKPIISLAFQLIRAGRGVRVLGRDIGQGLQALVKKMNTDSIDKLEIKLEAYLDREMNKMLAKGQEEKAAALADKVDTLRVFLDQLTEDNRTIPALFARIDALFTDNGKGKLTLCTVHKSKGLEWDRVFILDRKLMPSKYAKQEWQIAQETNIHYVAITRARQELYYIDSEGFQKPQVVEPPTPARPWTPEDDKTVGDSNVKLGELPGALTNPDVIDGQFEEVPEEDDNVMRQNEERMLLKLADEPTRDDKIEAMVVTLPQWAQDYIEHLQRLAKLKPTL
jgi:superfamily I DNA/RNA helicase